jgi:hypothetical protein
MQRAKTVFNFAYEEKLVPEPIHFGTGFQRPKRDKLDNEREAHRLEHGAMMFEAPELRQILGALKNRPALHAMILIAANCAFGQTDLAKLPRKAVDPLSERPILKYGSTKTTCYALTRICCKPRLYSAKIRVAATGHVKPYRLQGFDFRY